MIMGKHRVASAAIGLAALCGAGAARATTTIIDISAAGPQGTVVMLEAGSYSIHFIDSGQGGAHDAYSPWSFNSGCDGMGMNCSTGFIENLAIDFGHGTGLFDRVDGYQHGLLAVPGNNRIFATGAQAIADIEASDIVRATLAQASDSNAYVSIGNPISFTLAQAQSVNFFIYDSLYSDNRGGVSILLDDGLVAPPSGVPEPAGWAMMIAGFGLVGATLRGRARTTRLA